MAESEAVAILAPRLTTFLAAIFIHQHRHMPFVAAKKHRLVLVAGEGSTEAIDVATGIERATPEADLHSAQQVEVVLRPLCPGKSSA